MTAGGLVARRQVLRRLREYVMVVLLIALPVAGASGAAVLVASAMPTTRQEITSTLGQTAARVHWTGYETRQSVRGLNQWSGDEVTYREPADVVPGVERTLTLRTLWTRVGTSPAGVVIGPVTDPAFEGRYVLEQGRAAERGDEVLVTPALARDDGLGTGSTMTLHRVPGADGPRDLEVTVVGIMSEVGGGTDDRQVFARDDLAAGLPDPSSTASASSTSSEQYLVGDAVDWDEVRELGRAGFVVWSGAVVADPPPEGTPGLESEAGYGSTGTYAALGVVFAVFAGAEVALLAGAAFGVGARRQRRTLAVLAAVGADQRTLTRIVTRQGVWVGVVAAVTGLAVGVDLGIGVVALARRAGVDVGPFAFWGVHVPGVVVAGIGLFAVAVSWIAAVVPARRAARVDVMDSLRGGTASGSVDAGSDRAGGRGRRSTVLARVLVVGGVLACFGAGWTSYATSVPVGSRWWWAAFVGLAVSAVAALVGVLLLVPLLVRRLGRASTLAPVPLRLALRDASHGVARTAPAVAAVTTAAFVAVFGVSMSTAAARQSEDSFYRPYPAGTVAISYDQASDLRVPGGSPEAASLDSAAVAAVARDLPVGDRAVWQTPVPSGYDSNGAPVAVDAVTPWAVLTVPDRCDSSTGRLEGLSSREAQRITDADPACDYPLGSFTSQDNIIVTDEDGLGVTLGAAPSTAARAAFESGGVIAFDPSLVVDGEATIGLATPAEVADGFDASATPSTSVSLPAVVQRPTTLSTGAVLMSPGTAERLGFELTQRAVVMATDRQPTEDEAAGLRAAVTTATDGRATVETSPVDRGLDLALVLALLATTLVCAAAAAVALGLARAEGLSDQVTMQAVGGTDAQRRAMSFWQGVVVVGTGAVLGTILGLVPTGAMVWASDLPFAPPWWVLAVVAVGLPLVVAAGSALTSRRPTSLVRRPVLD
ncbi:FtsX-like permease family protein [Frigoribacterium sp. CFBP 8759]|uniref:FtsX-like permease family protein n=1 Tax=Frigoribacterium sp. CFBP 8759 TaxID=2775283 RepID=UPI00177E2CD5|nr:FtsX-like permease family protein [Frigoribacterium sp. CFBP 8759]MBD8486750.1 FtsX-like permease family protein [Frigoribacterium sp. CFBP 8759]